ncbi:MAG: hypothetical protein CBC12_01655 [Candidatus Puniceispirillum sp. TMED52]|nr:MAG: hypothetical protein CBC12_01655 [Candidatus Puniceispirillum sp. TMED52]
MDNDMSKNTREPQVRQFKLSSGEEIVCEVVDWTGEEEESELIIRKCMSLVLREGPMSTFYSFKPWMIYQENPDDFIILQSHHVMSIGFPTKNLMKHYDEAVEEMSKIFEERKIQGEEENEINKDVQTLMKKSTTAEEFLKELEGNDSASLSNVIPFSRDIH